MNSGTVSGENRDGRNEAGFDFFKTWARLGASEALPVPRTKTFWNELATGKPLGEGTRGVIACSWLVSCYAIANDFDRWEMHPEGDDVFFLLSGALELTLEDTTGKRRKLELAARQACVIPTGHWHHAKVVQAGELLVLTCGEGTRHRPL